MTGVDDMDGVKLLFGSRGWLLHRLSGTEPIIRIYAEHEDVKRRFLEEGYVAITRAVREVLLVEDDLAHPLLTLLDVSRAESAADVKAERASAEEHHRSMETSRGTTA